MTVHHDRFVVGILWSCCGLIASIIFGELGLAFAESIVAGYVITPVLLFSVYFVGAVGLPILNRIDWRGEK